jgi:hypothetical protein
MDCAHEYSARSRAIDPLKTRPCETFTRRGFPLLLAPTTELNTQITLGEADKQVGQSEGAGNNSYRSSVVKALAGLAAYPWALDSPASRTTHELPSGAMLRTGPPAPSMGISLSFLRPVWPSTGSVSCSGSVARTS